MKIAILDSLTLGADLDFSPLKELGELTEYGATLPEEVCEKCRENDVIILNKVKINESTLPHTGNVKLICVFATGFDNIDLDYCRKKGIAVCNVVGYSTASVAQVTVATVLYLANNMKAFTDHVRSGAYTAAGVANCLVPAYNEIAGKTWGIVGCGNIGTAVGRVAEAFGCKVIANKRTPGGEFENVDIDTLCEESDIITIHVPLSEATKGLIDKERIALMKKNVIIVNVARGAVTDEEAIAEAVKEGRIGAFGADVYSVEPFGENHPFSGIKHLDNVCLTPHMAWGAYEARERCLLEIVKNINAFYNGEIRNRVDMI